MPIFSNFWDFSNIYKVILSIHKYKTLRLLLSRMDCNSKNLGSIFPQIETMYFWLRSATSNIHEAIPQTRWGEGGWGGRVADSFDPPSIIHQPLNASKNSKYSPRLSKYSLLKFGWMDTF